MATNTQSGWLFLQLACLIGLLVVGYVGPRRTIAGLVVTRHAVGEAVAGEETVVSLTVTNPTRRTRHYLSVRDRLVTSPDAPEHLQWRILPIDHLAPGQSQTVQYSLPCPRRGIYRFESAWLESATPLGLYPATRPVPAPGEVVVFPTGPRLTRLPIHQSVPLTVVPLQLNHATGHSHDLAGIREYVQGEDIRFIHWPSTARTGDLMVKEFLDESSHNVVLLLDCSAQGASSLEEMVSAAAGMAGAAHHGNLALTVIASQGGEVKLLRHPRGQQHLYLLAGLVADGTLSWDALFRLAAPHVPSRSQVFLLTGRPGLTAEPLTALAGRRAHLSVLLFGAAGAAAAALGESRVPVYTLSCADELVERFANLSWR